MNIGIGIGINSIRASLPNGSPSSLTLQVLSDTSLGGTQTSTSTNQDGYYAYISTDNITFNRVLPANITWTNEDFVIINLTQGTTYYIYTTSYKGSKESAPSNTANASTILLAPSAATSQFIVDTILGKVDFTDNSGGAAQHEIYSNTNNAGDVLLITLNAGIVTYNDTTCKQNASVVYKVRAKKGTLYSDYVTLTALVTPLCWKTNQATRTNVVINALTIADGKTVNIDWGDGTNANYTGTNTNITKTYSASAVNVFNIKLSGDTNYITTFGHYNQIKSYGVVTNWVLPSTLVNFSIYSTGLTGVVTNWVLPSTLVNFSISSTGLSGSLPQITAHATNALDYQAQRCQFTDTNVTVFRKAMTVFNISNQNVPFPTDKIDKVLKALADWYQVNAPTASCTFTMNGANMGIPTGGASNVDLVRLARYFTEAGKTATIVVRTS